MVIHRVLCFFYAKTKNQIKSVITGLVLDCVQSTMMQYRQVSNGYTEPRCFALLRRKQPAPVRGPELLEYGRGKLGSGPPRRIGCYGNTDCLVGIAPRRYPDGGPSKCLSASQCTSRDVGKSLCLVLLYLPRQGLINTSLVVPLLRYFRFLREWDWLLANNSSMVSWWNHSLQVSLAVA